MFLGAGNGYPCRVGCGYGRLQLESDKSASDRGVQRQSEQREEIGVAYISAPQYVGTSVLAGLNICQKHCTLDNGRLEGLQLIDYIACDTSILWFGLASRLLSG